MGTLRGFGFTFDVQTGRVRHWYVDREGVQRWVDNDQPISGDKPA